MAAALPMRALTRMWQMLLKAIEEVAAAPNAMMAAEMALIRLTHVADLPDPEQLLRRLTETAPTAPSPAPAPGRGPAPGGGMTHAAPRATLAATPTASGAATALAVAPDIALARYPTFASVVELIRASRDVKLLIEVENHLRLVRYAPGRIEFEPTADAPRDLAATLAARLQALTGARWGLSVVSGGGASTIAEERDAARLTAEAEAARNPVVQAVFAAFPGARITAIRTREDSQTEAAGAALPEVEDEWDPFEE